MGEEQSNKSIRISIDDKLNKQNYDKSIGGVSSAALSIICYCLASIAMTVINKYIVSGKDFRMNFLLLAIQSSVCIGVVFGLKKANFINFRNFNYTDVKNWFPVSFLLVSVIYTGSKSLQYLQIPVYTIFKNLTIILIAYGEVLWFGGSVTSLTLFSFVLMVLSSIVAAWDDIRNALFSSIADVSFNSGYIWMLINCISSAGYVLIMRKRIKVTGFKDWDSMAYNNTLSIPLLAVSSLVIEDWSLDSLDRNFPPSNRYFLLSTIAISGAAAVGISYTTAWCVRTTSSTTYSMVGALNKLPVAASGLIFFGDPATPKSISAIAIGFVAGVIFAIAKNNQTRVGSASQSNYIPLSSNNK